MAAAQADLQAAMRTLRSFSWTDADHVFSPGDTDDADVCLDAWGDFYERDRGKIFTTMHATTRSPEARQIITASAQSAGACGNPACPLKAALTFKILSMCARCKIVGYCDVDCQRAHWRVHKPFCSANRVDRQGAAEVVVDARWCPACWPPYGCPQYCTVTLDVYLF